MCVCVCVCVYKRTHVRVCVRVCKHVERIFLSFAFWFSLSVKQLPVEAVWVGREEERWRRLRWRRGEEERSDTKEGGCGRQDGMGKRREGEKKPLSSMLYTSHTSGPGNKDLSPSSFLCPPSSFQTFSSHRKRGRPSVSAVWQREGGLPNRAHALICFHISLCLSSSDMSVRNNSNIIMLLHGLSAEFSLFTLLVVPPWAAPPSGSSSSHENTNITCGLIFITVWILLQPGGHSRPAELSSQQPVSYLCFRTLIPPRFATSNPAPLQRHFPKFKWGHGVKKKKAHFSSLSIPKVPQQAGGPNSHAPNWEFVRPTLKWAEHGTRPLMHKQLKYYLSNPSTLNVTYLVFYQNNVSRSNHTDFPNNVKHSKLALHRQ